MIDQKYRTLPDRHNTGIMGASFGGLFSLYTAMHHPDVFAKAGVLSPSLFVSEKEVYELPQKCTNKDMMIYMNVGRNEDGKMIEVMEKMSQSLKAAGWNDSNLRTKIYENGGHEPKVWADGFSNAYHWFFNES